MKETHDISSLLTLVKIVLASRRKKQANKSLSRFVDNRPRSIYQYSNMAPRLPGQTAIFGVVFFVSNTAKFRRRTSHEPNRMQKRENKGFCSFAFDSAREVQRLNLA